GDAPVQAYIEAMPGWKRDIGRRLDRLIARTVPGVSKAVRWNSPFYGIEGRGGMLSFHCFTKYVKVAFFRGTSLQPRAPDGAAQASRTPGWGNGEQFIGPHAVASRSSDHRRLSRLKCHKIVAGEDRM